MGNNLANGDHDAATSLLVNEKASTIRIIDRLPGEVNAVNSSVMSSCVCEKAEATVSPLQFFGLAQMPVSVSAISLGLRICPAQPA